MKAKPSKNSFRNRILARLPAAVLKGIAKNLTEIEAIPHDCIYEPKKAFRYVYFPETAVASILTVLKDGTETEVATIGYEGMVGLPAFLGAKQSPGKAYWQVPGKSFRLPTATLKKAMRGNEALNQSLSLYTQGFLTQIAQSATCNQVHNASQRCARWLLMTHDRVPGDEFELTQQFLAHMLGVRRTGVSEIAGKLQRAGLISYRRGHVTILNRKSLEKASCECYRVVQNEFNRLLGGETNET
jgi:CRP-like cAMP-binding protein